MAELLDHDRSFLSRQRVQQATATKGLGMKHISYARRRVQPNVIRHSVWLHLRFRLSYRDVEELLAERGFDVSYETIRRWVL